MERQESFIMYDDYAEHFSLLSDEELGLLMRAVFTYRLSGKVAELGGAVAMAFSFIKKRLDDDAEKYKQTCERNKSNGKKGGRPTGKNKTENNPQKPKITERFFEKPKKPDNDNDIDIDINNSPLNPPKGEVGSSNDTDNFDAAVKAAVEDWFIYKAERKEAYKPTGRRNLISEITNKVKELGSSNVVKAIRLSMSSNYKGIIWDKVANGAKTFSKQNLEVYNSGRYDYDKLERLAREKLKQKLGDGGG